jgi:hypothetical protein
MDLSKKLVLGSFAAATLIVSGTAPVAAEPLPGTTCSFFPSDSVFNTDISTLPVNGQSATWLSNMTQHAYLHPDFGTFAQEYGIPINVAPPPTTGLTPTFAYDAESDHPTEGYPISPTTNIEGGPSASPDSDRHALVVDSNLCKLYELYNLQNFATGQTPSAGSGAVWDLSSDAMRPDGWTSADAAGLPIAPLLLRPDEILAGSITHAIRFTAHCTVNSYIWPASHRAGSCGSAYPPMGARFRLKKGFDISHFSANAQVVLTAFKHYGLILADNGSDWYFQGTTDDWWGTTAGDSLVSELKTIPTSAFEAVDESMMQAAAGSYKAVLPSYATAGGALTAAPAGISAAAGTADAFARGTDGAVYTTHWNGTSFSSWTGLGGYITADPGAAAGAGGRMDVFVRGTDSQLYQRTWNGSAWGPWRALGGFLTTGPAASVLPGAQPQLDVWVAGSDHQLYRRSSADGGNTFGPWQALGGALTSDPAAVASSSTHIDVFVRGTDLQLYHRSWDQATGWSSWQGLGGGLASAPAAASCAAGHLDVFVLGSDSSIYRKSFNGTSWSGWTRLGGAWRSGVGATCIAGSSNVAVFARGVDDGLWMETLTAA